MCIYLALLLEFCKFCLSVNTLMIGKPEKGRLVENMLIQMAHTGQIMGKLDESELINILEKVSEQMQQRTTVKVGLQKE
jgi:programmed cell death protein 5